MLSRSLCSFASTIASRRFVTGGVLARTAAFSTVQKTAGDVESAGPSFIVSHPHELNRSALELKTIADTDMEPKSIFAIIAFSGKQYKITKDDVFVSHTVDGVDIGDQLSINDVLLVGSKFGTVIGRPVVEGATVKVEVEELTKDKKVITLKHRRRKNSRRTRGFRRDVAVLRVTDIIPPADAKDHLKV